MGRVVVAGSINMDVVATTHRHPKIGETIAGDAVNYLPGGKGANQAVAAVKLGAPTALVGGIGHDVFGRDLRAFLTTQGVDLTYVRDVPRTSSGVALITVADADNTIVVVPGANAHVTTGDVTSVAITSDDVAVSQFEIPVDVVTAFFTHARAARCENDPQPRPGGSLRP